MPDSQWEEEFRNVKGQAKLYEREAREAEAERDMWRSRYLALAEAAKKMHAHHGCMCSLCIATLHGAGEPI